MLEDYGMLEFVQPFLFQNCRKSLNKKTAGGIVTIERRDLLEETVASALRVAKAGASPAEDRRGLDEEVVGLFDQYREPLLRYLSSIGLCVPDGEEVLQEVFLALFQHLRGGKSRENLRGWLFRVAHNLGLQKRLRARREWAAKGEMGMEDTVMDPGPNPEQHLAERRAKHLVIAVLRALPEQDRRCLALRAEGLNYREVAGVLDMSLGAVSLSLTRSLARIARATQR
jgi:RNA polymerase sigma-70 factor (ECF subfamily)